MIRLRISQALVFVSLLTSPFMLLAHSFDIALIAPFSTAQSQVGENLWQGMRVATRERDAHDFETSDGHLGGVDSNLLRFDTAWDSGKLTQMLVEMGRKQGFIIAVLAPDQVDLRNLLPNNIPHIIIFTGEESVTGTAQIAPKLFTGEVKRKFETSYGQQYDDNYDATALGGYTAARLIDAAIRQTDGDFTHSKMVQEAFMQAIRRMNQ